MRKIWYAIKSNNDPEEIWEKYWEELLSIIPDYNIPDKYFNEILSQISPYLNTEKLILEGGAGSGKWMFYLKSLNCRVVGIDKCMEILKKTKNLNQSLQLVNSDIIQLPFKNNSFFIYISDGVMEHIEEGPDRAIKEASRILERNGILVLTVPYFNYMRLITEPFFYLRNQIRNARSIQKLFKKRPLQFFQYAFLKSEIIKVMKRNDFEIVLLYPFDHFTGFVRDFPLLQKQGLQKVSKILTKILMKFSVWISPHMILIIGKKVNKNVLN